MKARVLISSLIYCVFFVLAYYIGEYHGRESVVCPDPKKLYGYIDKHGELVWDEFPEAAYEMFYPEAIEK